MTYMLWQMSNLNDPLPENIRKALEFHEKKYGKAPNVVEYSEKLEPVRIEGVYTRRINIPKNLLLVAVKY